MAKTPAAGSPCKVTGDAINGFQVKQADMPVDFNLLTPDNKAELTGVDVYPSGSSTAISGQPTKLSTTGFSLNLANTGKFDIQVTVYALPSAQSVTVSEACTGGPALGYLAVQVQKQDTFSLEVV